MKLNEGVELRVDPKLRMIYNGDEEVNTRRAELSGAIKVAATLRKRFPLSRGLNAKPIASDNSPRPPKLKSASDDVKINVFIETNDGIDLPNVKIDGRRDKLMTAEVSQRQLEAVAKEEGVTYITAGDVLSAPTPVVVPRYVDKPTPRMVDSKLAENGGKGVLIGLIDVEGFDFAHEDFLDAAGNTRFYRIWDQGGQPGRDKAPEGFKDGVELTQERMNEALAWSRSHNVGATDLLPQSVQLPGSHGTHVASIAAGNKGVCPQALIAGVLIALSADDRDRRGSFYDSTRLAHAVDYLFQLGAKCGMPVVINISLGTNGHAHDGSSPICRWIDSALTVSGRCVCVAASNAGQEAPQFDGDIGFMMGRIHTSGRVAAAGLETNLEWFVVGNGISDGSENELEIWYEPQDRFEVMIREPSGRWIGPVVPGQYIENLQLENRTFLSIYSERYHPHNGANRIGIYLSPRLKGDYVGVQAGTWIVRLRGDIIRDGRFHAWIERDDPRPLGRIGEVDAWRFPSCFTLKSNVDNSSINTLACGYRILGVANCDDEAERVNISSSQGPTRDGRFKPEIAAPGTNIVAARGFSTDERKWVAMSGTSMSSPYVTGVAALMLAVEKRLTASQIIGIMRRTSQPLPDIDYQWQGDAGFGRIRPRLCLEEATRVFVQDDIGKKLGNGGAL